MASEMNREQVEQIIASYFGVHPRYFVYGGITIQVDISLFELEQNKRFIGWMIGTGPRAKITDK
jgi:hypothetical protein